MAGDRHPADHAQAIASFIASDSKTDTNPQSVFWAGASRIIAEGDFYGRPIPNYRTEILLQYSPSNLYALFVCPYEHLHLKPDPLLSRETFELWSWDVAELFIGDDFENIRRYKEFEVSPQGEWVDLDIDLDNPTPENGWIWQSVMEAAARIDAANRTWYAFMRIPWTSITSRAPVAGAQFRVNFYRCQGADPDRKYITWQPVNRLSFHTPECFGTLTLAPP